jgi:hypothetical protein
MSKNSLQIKTIFFVGILKATAKKSRVRIRVGSGPVSNVTDPEHWDSERNLDPKSFGSGTLQYIIASLDQFLILMKPYQS